jgi:hypothetical protein
MTEAPCIYCRELDVPRTEEHVLQDAFQRSLTLPTEVCGSCNSYFSVSDQHLVEYANVFIRSQVLKLFGLGLQEDPTTGVRLSSRVVMKGPQKGLVAATPQMFRHPDGTWQFRGKSVNLLQQMMKELASPTEKVKEQVGPSEPGKPPVALAVVRTAEKTFLVRGENQQEVSELAAKLRSAGLPVVFSGTVSEWVPPPKPPSVVTTNQIPVGSISRSLAKVALNYVCSLFGTDVALDPAFDGLRRFARYGEGSFLDFVSPAMLDEEQRDAPNPFLHPDRHALVLIQPPDGAMYRLGVQVMLYGKPVGMVRMSRTAQPILPLGTWRVTYFDHVKKTVEHLRIPDDGFRCFVNIEAVVPGAAAMLRRQG